MAFKGVRYRVIKALKDGTYLHAGRGSIEDKNALMTGDISPQQLKQSSTGVMARIMKALNTMSSRAFKSTSSNETDGT